MFSSYYKHKRVPFESLKDKTFVSVEKEDGDGIVFKDTEGNEYHMVHVQDCCEDVYIESVVGDLTDLIGNPVLVAEESSNSENPLNNNEESFTWTFYKLATIKGWVDIRWYGSSNGYYSESVDLYQIQ